MNPTTVVLQSNDVDTEIYLGLVLGVFAGLWVLHLGFETYRVGRLIRDTPAETVRSAAVGRTELHGEAVPKDFVFDCPFTDGTCLYAHITVEEYRESNNEENSSWWTIYSKTLAPPFYVDDGTGAMLVDADANTTFEIGDENTTEKTVGKREEPPEAIQEFLGGTNAVDPAVAPGETATVDSGGPVVGTRQESTGSGSVQTNRVDGIESPPETAQDVHHVARGELNTNEAILDRFGGDTDESTGGNAQREVTGADQIPSGFVGTIMKKDSNTAEILESTDGPTAVEPTTEHKRRYVQEVLPEGGETYVFGAAERRDADASGTNEERLVIRTDPSTDQFIVSDRHEQAIARGYTRRAIRYLLLGLLISVASFGLLAHLLVA